MRNDFNFNKVSKFVKTLYRLVSDDRFKEIGWTENGKGFRINDKENFMKNVLPYLSKTREYSAFLRQLHLYGFIKVKTTSLASEEYFHGSFQKDREDLLPCVKHNRDQTLSVYEGKTRFTDPEARYQEALEYINRKNYSLENEVCALKERVDKQEGTINGLVELLSRMFKFSKSEGLSCKLVEGNNVNNLDKKKLKKEADKFKIALPLELGEYEYNKNNTGQEIYKLARNSFVKKDLEETKKIKGEEMQRYKVARDEVFGNSDGSCEDNYSDDFF